MTDGRVERPELGWEGNRKGFDRCVCVCFRLCSNVVDKTRASESSYVTKRGGPASNLVPLVTQQDLHLMRSLVASMLHE